MCVVDVCRSLSLFVACRRCVLSCVCRCVLFSSFSVLGVSCCFLLLFVVVCLRVVACGCLLFVVVGCVVILVVV